MNNKRKIYIPPSWKNVKISKNPNHYLQATGVDKKGRTQYVYHPKFIELTSKEKYNRQIRFVKNLPKLYLYINKHKTHTQTHTLSNDDLDFIMALLFRILLKTFIRVGNECYDTFGLTTLQKKHIKINPTNDEITFDFIGKKNIRNVIKIKSKDIARDLGNILKKRSSPSDPLFEGVTSLMLNEKLKDIMGYDDITCKDFRTFAGNKLFIDYLIYWVNKLDFEHLKELKIREKIVRNGYKYAAESLNNTSAVSKKSYVNPNVSNKFLKDPMYFKGKDPHNLLIALM